MTAAPDRPSLDALLAHREWIRDVARRLAANAFDADDLEQEAWLAAMRSPPRRGSGLGAWAGAVVRNAFRKRRRTTGRRDARERAAARPEAIAGGAALVAEAEAHRRVVDAVLALPDPLRETVLLRYFEGLPPREVAARTHVPVETARTRLKRAAELLRDALGGERDDWLGALAPLLTGTRGTPPETPFVAPEGIVLATRVAVVVAIALCITAGVVEFRRRAGEQAAAGFAEDASLAASRTRRSAAGLARAARPLAGDAAEGAAAAPKGEPATPPRTDPRGRLVGRVLLADGSPATDTAVRADGSPAWVVTDADGRYTVDAIARGYPMDLWVARPGWVARPFPPVTVRADEDVAVADVILDRDPWLTVGGRVTFPDGAPAAGSVVSLSVNYHDWVGVGACGTVTNHRCRTMFGDQRFGDSALPGAETVLAPLQRLATNTAEDGSFSLRLPLSYGAVVLAVEGPTHARAWSRTIDLASDDSAEVRIEVDAPPRIAATVVDADTGAPLAGARVAFAGRPGTRSTTDALGRFTLLARPDDGRSLVVAHDGHVSRSIEIRGGPLGSIALHAAHSISGRLVGHDGSPLAGVHFREVAHAPLLEGSIPKGAPMPTTRGDGTFDLTWLTAGTYDLVFGGGNWDASAPEVANVTVRGVAAGTSGLVVVAERAAETIEGRLVDPDGASAEAIGVRATREGEVAASAGTWDGRFVLRSLRPGTYRIEWGGAMRLPSKYRRFAPIDVEAGTRDVTIVVPFARTIAGRIVGRDGRPAVGATVTAVDAGKSPWVSAATLWPTTTDHTGAFRLGGLDEGEYRLVSGSGWESAGAAGVWLEGGDRVRAGAEDVVLTEVLSGSIEGCVTDTDGRPVPGVKVSVLWDPADERGRSAWTNGGGRFRVEGLAPGRAYTVVFPGGRAESVAAGARDVRLCLTAR